MANNEKTTVLLIKTENFVKFHQNSSKINIFTTMVVFHHFVSFSSKPKSLEVNNHPGTRILFIKAPQKHKEN